MHADQLTVPPETVRELVDEQFPAVARPAGHGASAPQGRSTRSSGSATGSPPASRCSPATSAATRQWLESEAAAARELARPHPVPDARAGGAGRARCRATRCPWSVQTWLPGSTATDAGPGRVGRVRPRPGRAHPRCPRDRHPRPHASPARAAAATCAPTTRGWRRASNAASSCWTCPGCAGSGHGLRELPRSGCRRDDPRRPDSRQRAGLRRPPRRRPRRRRPGTGRSLRWTWWVPGTCSRPVRAGCSATTSGATTWSGSAAGPGPSRRRWAPSGTTPTATRP